MGQEELVLKIPSEDTPPSSVGSSIGSSKQLARPPSVSGDSGDHVVNGGGNRKSVTRALTHSRESSGASVKFVNGTGNGNGHRRSLSKGSGQSGESHVIILQSPSGEDITLSDRLSNEEDDVLEVDLEEEELRSEEEEDVDGELQLRIEDETRMHRPNDLKSQNSDYGSFCNTPCDGFGLARPAGAAGGAASSKTGGAVEPGAEPGGSPGTEEHNQGGDDSSVMANDSYQRQPLLTRSQDSCSSDDEVGANSSGYTRRKSRHPKLPPSNNDATRIDVDDAADGRSNSSNSEEQLPELPAIPAEPLKTFLAFVFIFLAWVATTTSLALTHERVPDIDPLPDAFLDNVHYQPWGLDASEIIIMVATIGAFTLAIFHQHRFIVLRRIFLLGGIHYFYRAITMYITVLPKADPHYKCAPKLDEISFVDIARRVLKLLSGMGLSINGQHIYCGDYIYSGHTMTLLMTYLVVREYSPKKWFLLHWFSFCVTVTGVLTLLFARGHYSIDVLIAYYITTRLWWIYHTLANNAALTAKENKHNYLSNFWWWVIFRYMEANVGRPVPKGFNWPIPEVVARRIPYIRNWTSGGGRGGRSAGRCDNEVVENNPA